METIKFIKTLPDQSPAGIRSSIYKKGILSSYNHDDGRMVLYNSKTARFNKPLDGQNLWPETNGLVIDTKNLTVLVTPPLSFRSNINVPLINTHLKNNLYDLLLIEDGTVISLYYWPPLNSWRIATSRGYDMTNSKWGDITYGNILKELVESHGTTEAEFYDSLDRGECYTFGFKHRSMHAFWEGSDTPINRLWFIQSVNRDTGAINHDFRRFEIPSQKKCAPVSSTKPLFKALTTSLQDFTQKNTVLYGFILRSRDRNATGLNSNIMLESSLLQKIRQLYYHSSFNEIAQERKYDREKYTVVHSYLSSNIHKLFITLFPQYKPQYQQLDNITSNLVRSILTIVKNGGKPASTDSPLDKTIQSIYESLNNRCALIANNRQNARIVATYILNATFTDVYYGLLQPDPKPTAGAPA